MIAVVWSRAGKPSEPPTPAAVVSCTRLYCVESAPSLWTLQAGSVTQAGPLMSTCVPQAPIPSSYPPAGQTAKALEP